MIPNFLISVSGVFYEAFKFIHKKIFTAHFIVDTIYVFLCLILLSISFTFFYLFIKRKRQSQKVYLQNSLNGIIGEIAICENEYELNNVFSDIDNQKVLVQFQKNETDRIMLITELAEASKKFRGATMDNILWLFDKLKLQDQLLKNLKNKKWHKKARAIQQLAYLQQKNTFRFIFPFTNHNNELLRMEAQIAIVKMTGFEGLAFLNSVTYPVSEWQQLRLIEELSTHTTKNLGDIKLWLNSENISVVNFALRLIEIYRQYEFYDEVKKCLNHGSMTVCKKAVITLANISDETTADLLLMHYPGYDSSTQLRILKILQSEGTASHLPFLITVLKNPDDSFKMEAARAIMKINENEPLNLEGIIDDSRFPWNIILPQIKNVA